MKPAIILIFLFYQLNLNYSKATKSNACMNQKYEIGTDAELEKKFLSEYSLLEQSEFWIKLKFFPFNALTCILLNAYYTWNFTILVKSWIYGLFVSIEAEEDWYERLKEFCACAIYKKLEQNEMDDELVIRSYENILENMHIKGTFLTFDMKYYFFKRKFEVSGVDCISNQDQCIITRGLRKKSDTKMIYDLYVGIDRTEDTSEFRGVIKDVDFEGPVKVTSSSWIFWIILM